MSTLTHEKAIEAREYNKRKARSVGWLNRWGDCAGHLELPQATVSGVDFSQRVAAWQEAQDGLKVDGKLGSTTWGRMKRALIQSYPRRTPPAWLLLPPSPSPPGSGRAGRRIAEDRSIAPGGHEAPWIDVARSQMATRWRRDGAHVVESSQTVDEDYFQATPKWGDERHKLGQIKKSQNGHWCAAFVNYCLHVAGYSHTGSAGARSFARSGWRFKALPSPKRGCVIVLKNSDHVGFLDRWTNLPDDPSGNVAGSWRNGLYLLGGNQSDTICSKQYNRELVAARDRYRNRSPYLWPEVGPAGCNADIPTAQPHHCGINWR